MIYDKDTVQDLLNGQSTPTAGAGRGLVNPPTVLPAQRRGTMPKPTAGREIPTEYEDPTQNASSAAVRGFADQASLGFAPAIAGGLTATISSAAQLAGSKKADEPWADTYRRVRDAYKSNDKQFQDNSPVAYGAGQVAGAVASTALPGGIIAKGAASGLGHSEADLTKGEVGQAALDTGLSGAAAGLGNVLTKGAGTVAKKAINSVGSDSIVPVITGGSSVLKPVEKFVAPVEKYISKVQSAADNPPNPQLQKLFGDTGSNGPLIDKVLAPMFRGAGKVKDLAANTTDFAAKKAAPLAAPVAGTVAPQTTNTLIDFVKSTFGLNTPAGEQIVSSAPKQDNTTSTDTSDKPGRVSASVPQLTTDENGDRWLTTNSGQRIKLN